MDPSRCHIGTKRGTAHHRQPHTRRTNQNGTRQAVESLIDTILKGKFIIPQVRRIKKHSTTAQDDTERIFERLGNKTPIKIKKWLYGADKGLKIEMMKNRALQGYFRDHFISSRLVLVLTMRATRSCVKTNLVI